MSFNQVLENLTGNRTSSLLDIQKAFGVIASLYVTDALNLVHESTFPDSDAQKILARADTIFADWEEEMVALKTAILAFTKHALTFRTSWTKAVIRFSRHSIH
jgi:hypothetical protein